MNSFVIPEDNLNKTIWIVGIFALFRVIYGVMRFIQVHILMSSDMSRFGASKGGYAVLTGASEGIGRALSLELASRGFNLVVVARTKSRLEALKKDIRATYPGTDVRVLPLDCFAVKESCAALSTLCKELPVTLLVNNVGCEHGEPEPMEGKSLENMQAIIDLNITFNAQLCRAALSSLLANAQRLQCEACIVNLASVAATVEQPCVTTYSAAKAFNTTFSRALAKEGRCHHNGLLRVTNLRPAFVESNMSGLKASGLKGLLLGVVTPQYFAKAAVAKFGLVDDVSPVAQHALAAFFISRVLPSVVSERFLYALSMKRFNNAKEKREREEQLRQKNE